MKDFLLAKLNDYKKIQNYLPQVKMIYVIITRT